MAGPEDPEVLGVPEDPEVLGVLRAQGVPVDQGVLVVAGAQEVPAVQGVLVINPVGIAGVTEIPRAAESQLNLDWCRRKHELGNTDPH